MKHQLLATTFFLALSVTACGDSTSEAAQPDAAGSAAEADVEADASGPQVGDRVKEPSPREAATAKRKAELAKRGITEIGWEDLMPEGEEERIAEMYQAQMATLYSRSGGISEGSAADQAIQIGTFNTVPEMDGMKIRLPGYTVPFDYGSDAEISEFLLVPYYGACLHAPPPPPNQTVFVKTSDKIKLKDLSQAVWIEGTLKTQRQNSSLADAAYTIEMTDWEIYEY